MNMPKPGSIVGVVDSREALAIAEKLGSEDLDYLEWRADAMIPRLFLPRLKIPWILTVRHPAEGGKQELTTGQRRETFERLLPWNGAVDIELRSFSAMESIAVSARKQNSLVIASFHDFKKTPSVAKLRDLAAKARDVGADIFKVATRTEKTSDIGRLSDLLQSASLPVAVMGMGALGFGSRMLFAQAGSVLNYGWLHRPNVPGQWEATALKQMVANPEDGIAYEGMRATRFS